jgi:hypothetical protein
MDTKSRESSYGTSFEWRPNARAEAGKEADRHACEAWNKRGHHADGGSGGRMRFFASTTGERPCDPLGAFQAVINV